MWGARDKAALWAGWLVAVACGACLNPGAHTCPGGGTCPEGMVCAEVTDPDQQLCVQPEQIAACTGMPDYTHCGSDARCYGGVCLPVACGNGRVDAADPNDPSDVGEACDDGNQTSGDGCSSDCLSNEKCGNGIVDPIRGELCDDGNHIQHDGCDSRCQPETPRWVQVPLGGPSARGGNELVYDVKRGRFVLFGGFDPVRGFIGDTWEWDGGWVLASPIESPAPRSGYAMVYDAARSRTVLFGGGNTEQLYDDTWEWDGTAWTAIATAVAPTPRADAAMAYDSHRQRIVLFGGLVHEPTRDGPSDDTWEFDGTSWTPITTAHTPGARDGATMAYDAARDVIVLFGGSGLADTWEFGLDKSTGARDWKQVDLGTGPSARAGARMVYDNETFLTISPEIVLFGGSTPMTRFSDMWSWDGTSWLQLTPANPPPPRAWFGLAADPVHGELVLFGDDSTIPDSNTYEERSGDWVTSPPTFPSPVNVKFVAAAAYDLERATVVLVDNESGNLTWELDGGFGWQSASGGPSPSTMIAYDPAHGVTVELDGVTDGTTYTFALGSLWTAVAGPTPPQRQNGAMAWDAAGQQVLLFGGETSTGVLDDTWAWNGASWSELAPAIRPSARVGAAIGSDPIRKQVVLFGGTDGITDLADTWVWDGSSWSELHPAVSPPARSGATLLWNASRQRLTLFGGAISTSSFEHDVWEWDGSAWSLVDAPNPPPGRSSPIMFPSADGTALYVFGGSIEPRGRIVDLWRLRWEGTTTDESCRENVDADGDGLAGCADPDCWSECTPLCPPGASCPQGSVGCGDGVCTKPLESCRLCTADCACTAKCGDSYCDPGESADTCPGDCP